jgi:N-methylhydantoinase A
MTGTRQVCFDELGYLETPLYQRASLAPGDVLRGPAVIEEFGSTIPLHPGFSCEVDGYVNLLIRRSSSQLPVVAA